MLVIVPIVGTILYATFWDAGPKEMDPRAWILLSAILVYGLFLSYLLALQVTFDHRRSIAQRSWFPAVKIVAEPIQ